jgi:hypothetical protein
MSRLHEARRNVCRTGEGMPSWSTGRKAKTMSDLTVLSDAELDAVSGGIMNGGNGGTALVGAQVQATGYLVILYGVNLGVNKSTANANGGNGGNIWIHR